VALTTCIFNLAFVHYSLLPDRVYISREMEHSTLSAKIFLDQMPGNIISEMMSDVSLCR